MNEIRKKLAFLGEDLTTEILNISKIEDIPKDTEILREDQYIKVLPLVISGLIKVFTRFQDKELLLYYIKPTESCIMSFSASNFNQPCKIFAVTEQDSQILLLPSQKIPSLLKKYPQLNTLFFQQFNLRYQDLLETVQHVISDKLDKRLEDYLLEKARLTETNKLKITHQIIANELGTAREVISRVMKKLEAEGKLKQRPGQIEMLLS